MKTRSDKSLRAFYDTLAPDYDLMTAFNDRVAREEEFFRFLAKKYHIRTAIDAGCGTGVHSILLARLGVKVTAVDISRKMITATRANAQKFHLPIRGVESSFGEMAKKLDTVADALFCMGNSLAHMLTEEELLDSLANFRALLRPKGLLVLQLGNYDRILKERARLQHVRDSGGKSFVRSYRYLQSLISFSIDIKTSARGRTLKNIRIKLNPIRSGYLQKLLIRSGFKMTAKYGSLQKEPFSKGRSRDVIILAKKAYMRIFSSFPASYR